MCIRDRFKSFGGVDAFPLCVKTKDVDEFVQTVYNISGSFGGILADAPYSPPFSSTASRISFSLPSLRTGMLFACL